MSQVEALYDEHGAALLEYLRRNRPSSDSAEDLLQETFLQALRSADRLAEVRSPRTWLFGIARNVARTALRRRRATELPAQIAASSDVVDPQIEQMHAAIARLPELQREALQLRVRYDLTYEEIAAVLEIPLGTVRSRLHHAVRRLRDAMTRGDSGQQAT